MLLLSLLYPLVLLVSSASALLTTGAPGAVGTRYEIRQLASSYPRQYTLFLLAMQQFEALPQSQQNSYYQISGIHGVPRVSFDGVNQCSSCTNADGYCTHSSILFLAWHRPYLALFEQRIVAIAKNIASQYPDSTRAAYQAAATSLRLPYWDWAARPPNGGNALSNQLSQASVQVDSPTGVRTINNPLYQYTFSNSRNLVYSPFTTWPVSLLPFSPRRSDSDIPTDSHLIRKPYDTLLPTPLPPTATREELWPRSTTFVRVCKIDYTSSSPPAPRIAKLARTRNPLPDAPPASSSCTIPFTPPLEDRQRRIPMSRVVT